MVMESGGHRRNPITRSIIPDQARSPSHCSSLRTNRPRAAPRHRPRHASTTPQPRPARWAVRRSGSGRSRSAIAVLFSQVLVTVSIPARSHLQRGRLGCRVSIQERPRSWPAKLAVVGLAGSGQDLEGDLVGQPEAALALNRADPREKVHSGRNSSSTACCGLIRPISEHVARRVSLGSGVEKRPTGAPAEVRPAGGH